jgi:hypothetical protein
VHRNTKQYSNPGQSLNAASTIAFVAIAFPLRLPSSLVISTRDAQSFTRSRSDSAEKFAKMTLWMAPMCAHARNAAAACHIMGR